MVNVIEISDLEYRYPDSEKPVLSNINLSIKKGETLGIVGPTGAGKTTLCLCIAGLIPHSIGGELKGEVNIGGIKTTEHELREFIHKIGIVFQDPELQLFGITVEEDIAIALKNMGLGKDEVKRRVKWALKEVGLEGFEKRFPYSLSGGEKQRVAIASALAIQPEVLILDEPTSELDPVGKLQVINTLRKLKKEFNTTTIIVEHNTEALAYIADRLVVLKEGQIILQGEPHDVFRRIKEDMGVRIPDVSLLGRYFENNPKWRMYGYPLTLEEAYNSLTSIFRDAKVHPNPHEQKIFRDVRGKHNEPLIEVENLTYIYGRGTDEEKTALKNINLKIYRGEFVALIGQNGSGKTTLAKNLNGLLKPTYGVVRVRGLDTKKTSTNKLANIVGYCFQNPDHQIFKSTVYDEVAFGPRNFLLSEDEVDKRVKDALEFVGLVGYENRNPMFLGKGERQKVAVASIIAMQPEVMIIDEPTTGMDYVTSRSMMETLKKLHTMGKTIIIITHDMYIVAEYTERVVVLHDGEIILDGAPDYVFSQVDKLKEVSIMPPQITQLAYLLREYVRLNILSVKEAYEEFKSLMSAA